MPTRRAFLGHLLAGAAAARPALANDWQRIVHDAARFGDRRAPAGVAADEDFWAEIQRAFTLDRTLINLNNGGVSPSPRVVQEAMARYLALSNQAPVYTMWNLLEPQVESVRRELAREFGCDPEELAITRNASESLETCQLGLPLERGDEVLTTNQDYPRMLTTWEQRARREGIVVKQLSFPVPAPSQQFLVDLFARNIGPRTRVIHCCHITNLTGQIFPIRELMALARPRGIEVIVDGAHAFAHFPFTRDQLDCDFYGCSLHKWLLAPHGTGLLYVRREKIERVWPLMAAPESMRANIRKFEEIGTHPAANHNAIAEALEFHRGIGAERKLARLVYLRDHWMDALAPDPRIRILTARDPAQSAGLALVDVAGYEPGQLTEYLWQRHRIIVTPIVHPEFRGLRITPNVYTTLRELDVFVAALRGVLKNGLKA
ncbi:MAG: aminotransferase class V-fold PLP-dependent enzyme [Gemmatimonadetes bacterium]|nr:aminotransferase class V-fold PLP-dependent enzyme [Gemmatimonadota bacterium]